MSSDRFSEFRSIQERLRKHVRAEPLRHEPQLVAAVDVHLGRGTSGIGAAVLCNRAGNELERAVVSADVEVPYVPGYLSFREMPLCREAIGALRDAPDVVLVDGQGIAHPRRFGLACHLGVELDIPTIGVAKSLLAGKYEEPAPERGSMSPLWLGDEIVGMAVRTRTGVRPLYVSIGHRITLSEAIELVLSYANRYRLPEPSRLAHNIARDAASASRDNRQ
jgi:deoxyribonuclease V